MTTTADFIREMRALCERATPGPWNSELVPNSLSETLYMVHSFVEAEHDTVCGSYKGHDHHDMQFIAAARTALPELLDKVEKLEKDLAAETTRREEVEAERDTALSALNTERTMREAAAAALTEWQGGIKQGQRIIDAESYKRLWQETKAANARLREALEAVEYRGEDDDCCPICMAMRKEGHSNECIIGSAIAPKGKGGA